MFKKKKQKFNCGGSNFEVLEGKKRYSGTLVNQGFEVKGKGQIQGQGQTPGQREKSKWSSAKSQELQGGK